MSMNELHEAYRLIDRHNDIADMSGPRPLILFRKAEAALGIRIPPTYRDFLLRCGDLTFGSMEIFGLFPSDFESSCIPDAIWYTLDNRRLFNVAPTLILVQPSGYGSDYAIDTSRTNADGDSPVVEVYINEDETPWQDVAEDFGAFLLDRVKWELDIQDRAA